MFTVRVSCTFFYKVAYTVQKQGNTILKKDPEAEACLYLDRSQGHHFGVLFLADV